MDCHQFEEMSGAYALGATSAIEQREAEAHLATCANCRQVLQELRTVTDLLPLAVLPVEPSPDLKRRIMALVATDAKRQTTTKLSQQPGQHYPWWGAWQTRVALILLLLLSGLLAAWNVTLQQQLAGISTTQSLAYSLQGTSPAAGVKGEAVYLPQLHLTLLTVYNLPLLQGNEVYQGWLVTQNRPQSLGLLQIQDGIAMLNVSNDIRSADLIAVSREPGPGASQGVPRGQIVATGSLHPHRGQRGAREDLGLTLVQRARKVVV